MKRLDNSIGDESRRGTFDKGCGGADDKWSREPALPHLLRYARVAGVNAEVLIDDEQELPDKLATDPLHGVVRRSPRKVRKPLKRPKKRR